MLGDLSQSLLCQSQYLQSLPWFFVLVLGAAGPYGPFQKMEEAPTPIPVDSLPAGHT